MRRLHIEDFLFIAFFIAFLVGFSLGFLLGRTHYLNDTFIEMEVKEGLVKYATKDDCL
jgi:hypothetical protein